VTTTTAVKTIGSLSVQLRVQGVNCAGYGICPKYPLIDPDLSAGAKSVYALLCCFIRQGDEKREVYPTIATIKSMLGVKTKAVIHEHINELIQNGYITVRKGFPAGSPCKGFPQNIYTILDKPAKFDGEPNFPELVKHYKKIREHGLFANYGLIPLSIMRDTRLKAKSKLIYALFAVHAENGKGEFKKKGRVSQLKLRYILKSLNMTENTYRNYYDPLCELNYITAFQPHNNGRLGSNFYLLNEKPDAEKAAKKSVIAFYDENGGKKIRVERKPAPPLEKAAPAIANKFSYADTAGYYANRDGQTEQLYNVVTPKIKEEISDITLDRLSRENFGEYLKILERVKADFWQNDGVPYSYIGDRLMMTAAIRELTGYGGHIPDDDGEYVFEERESTGILFTEALIDICCGGIPKRHISASRVVESLNAFVKRGASGFFRLDSRVKEAAVDDLGAKLRRGIEDEKYKVVHERAFLGTCIWEILRNGYVGLQRRGDMNL